MSGRGKSAKSASTLASTSPSMAKELLGQEPILQAIVSLKEELLAKIDEKMQGQSADIKSQMDVNVKIGALEQQFQQLEDAASEQSTTVSTLECEVETMKKDIANLKAHNEDLDNRSRRCNLRIIGVKEGRVKGPVNYVAHILGEALELEKAPLLDRAHRALRNLERGDNPQGGLSRTFIVRCHYYQEKVEILKKAAGKLLKTADGDDIRIFPDYSLEVSRQRAKFNEVKKLLRDGKITNLRFGVVYPAELKITLPDGTVQKFKDPSTAKDYVTEKIINRPA